MEATMTVTTILRITVDGAAYDEPEVLHVADSPAVRRAIAAWQAACDFHGDGSVAVAEDSDPFGAMDAEEFLQTAANAIACDQGAIDELLWRWRGAAV
jgi:hypothetical protein